MKKDRLAIDGGSPLRTTPFNPWPHHGEDEIEAAASVLQSGRVNYWTGEEGRQFEEEYAAYCGCKYGVAVANGTVALELALYALGIGPGDEVITSSRTFIASASSIVVRSAVPVIADVDRDSQNITAKSIAPLITEKTKAIIAVHLAGWPCDMDPIMELAQERGLKVIEDCAQAHGATYWGRPIGSLGHAAAFSFCQDKIMSTGGEGGMLITNDEGIWRKAWEYKDHGKSWNAVYEQVHPSGFQWLHESFGTNWRLTEMQSAIGRVQLKKLDGWVKKRRENAAFLNDCFNKFEVLRVPVLQQEIGHSYYKYSVFVRPEKLLPEWTRDRIMEAIVAEGIPCFTGSCSEIYLEKAFQKAGIAPKERLPIAKELGESSLMFLVHPNLGENEMNITCQVVEKVLSRVTMD